MNDTSRDVLDRGSLPALLADRARRASDRRLVLDALAGLVAGALFVVLRPPMWIPLAALGGCLAMFGTWGILDRELSEASAGRRARSLSHLRTIVAALGVVTAVIFGFSFLFGMMGSWIS